MPSRKQMAGTDNKTDGIIESSIGFVVYGKGFESLDNLFSEKHKKTCSHNCHSNNQS
jgi:hypothetical protein